MLEKKDKQQSIYSILYNKISEDHLLKQINRAVDFSFVNDMFEDCYCKYYGRLAKEREMMIKLLVLEYLYNLSDKEAIREANLNIAYMWFLGINPEEELPDASLLSKFRTQRLKDVSVDEIMKEIE
ncbi:transposase [Caloranaerobacter azorensis]|uniref:Transposase n=1 Tax=Caloranaerobacter azorensis TaxID=116090 RepID=A0A6P1YFB7_9FIRM|nr:transposase [Caloranaerobacter azorensis]